MKKLHYNDRPLESFTITTAHNKEGFLWGKNVQESTFQANVNLNIFVKGLYNSNFDFTVVHNNFSKGTSCWVKVTCFLNTLESTHE